MFYGRQKNFARDEILLLKHDKLLARSSDFQILRLSKDAQGIVLSPRFENLKL